MRKRMEYKIISGSVVEIKRSYFSASREYSKPRGTRRAGTSSVKKIKANEKSSARNLARMINCNFVPGDALVTLKYDADHYPAGITYEAAKEDLKKFRARLNRAYQEATGKKLRAIWVTANWSPKRDAPSRLHHHLVLPEDALEPVREIWKQFGGPGTFEMTSIDNRGDHSDLAAYMLANVHGRPAGENKWSCCRGMDRPIYTEPVEVADLEDIRPERGSVIKDVEESRDEDGRLIGKYLRCLLPGRPKVRGGQIVLPGKHAGRRI